VSKEYDRVTKDQGQYPVTWDFETRMQELVHDLVQKDEGVTETTRWVVNNVVALVGECEHDSDNLTGLDVSLSQFAAVCELVVGWLAYGDRPGM